jgi:phospholipid/cholesterol/gamma-HCH transport system permease protein
LFFHTGRYFMLLFHALQRPEKFRVFFKRTVDEIMQLGISSLGIVVLMSVFMGAVIVIQTASAIDSPWIPAFTVGFTARQSIILEFSPTIISLILAGKVGSNIASELGTMRVSEQIDAIEIMGVNSAGYLVLPKIAASVFIFPILIIYSMVLGLLGGYIVSMIGGLEQIDPAKYILGIRAYFEPFNITYALIKTVIFGFIITSISSYYGYYATGGALEVGKASTKAVVYSSVFILFANLLITQLLLI